MAQKVHTHSDLARQLAKKNQHLVIEKILPFCLTVPVQEKLDLDNVFGEDTGQHPGTTVWRIELFLPTLVDEGKCCFQTCRVQLPADAWFGVER